MNDMIIVVDDMPLALEFTKAKLGQFGYRNVTVCEEPHEALRIVQSGADPAIVITDFSMPRMNGAELLEAISSASPQTSGIIVTGAPDEARNFCSKKYPVLEKGHASFFSDLRTFLADRLGKAG